MLTPATPPAPVSSRPLPQRTFKMPPKKPAANPEPVMAAGDAELPAKIGGAPPHAARAARCRRAAAAQRPPVRPRPPGNRSFRPARCRLPPSPSPARAAYPSACPRPRLRAAPITAFGCCYFVSLTNSTRLPSPALSHLLTHRPLCPDDGSACIPGLCYVLACLGFLQKTSQLRPEPQQHQPLGEWQCAADREDEVYVRCARRPQLPMRPLLQPTLTLTFHDRRTAA